MKHTLRFEKTWQEETKSSVPRMVGNLVYGVSPVSAALSVRRREFYALLGDKSSILCLLKSFGFEQYP